jgi:hypothetical protein
MNIRIPVSIGELFDKISILENKLKYIQEPSKHINIHKEWTMLVKIAKKIDPNYHKTKYFKELSNVNEELWHIEDGKRECERKKKFDSSFIELARSVYKKNDLRAKIKRKINEKYGSSIVEEKSHKKY